MDRRHFISLLGGAALAHPRVSTAQPQSRPYRVAQLSAGTIVSRQPLIAGFLQGLSELGYQEGRNLLVEHRYAEGHFERLPALARELLAWNPDVIFASTTPGALAAKAATSSTPIVFVAVADAVGVGLITSLSRPGGNVTGITNVGAELAGKRVEIIKEIVPSASKIALLLNPDDQNAQLQIDSAKAAAATLAIEVGPVLHIRSEAEVKPAFEGAANAGARAAVRMIDPLLSAFRDTTAQQAISSRLPVIYPFRDDVVQGGLVSYGPNLLAQYRQSATLVHRILTGAKPADLPVEQPTKFELVINLKAARAIDLAVPPTLIARAEEVIE